MRRLYLLAIVCVAPCASGCMAWYADEIGAGVARLSIRNVAAVVQLINADTTCGFASEAAASSLEVDGSAGDIGVARWIVDRCSVDVADGTELSRDCSGDVIRIGARLTVSARRSVSGFLTGDPNHPVIPVDDEAVTIELTRVVIERLAVDVSGSDKKLIMNCGTLTGIVIPRMAVDASNGACAAPTPNARFEDIRWIGGLSRLLTADRDLEVAVSETRLNAVAGSFGGEENRIWGDLWIGDNVVTADNASDALDPEYDAARFKADYACGDSLRIPERFDCSIESVLGEAAARLLIQNLGELVRIIDADPNCGFASTDPMQLVELIAGMDEDGFVSLRLRADACTVGSAADTTLATSSTCVGTRKLVVGQAEVTAIKHVHGKVTFGDPPIAPADRESVWFELGPVSLSHFGAYTMAPGATGIDKMLLVRTGRLSAVVRPILGEAADERGEFTVATPVVAFDDVELNDALVTLVLGEAEITFPIDEAHLSAFNGSYRGRSNDLSGWLSVGGERIELDPGLRLDPAFEQAAFDETYACADNLLEPVPAD